MNNATAVLKKYWNYSSFRPPQEQIIKDVLTGKNVVALLPTGGGKSICFQIPALLKEGICIVISPLIALMSDQVQSLHKKGIKAIALTSVLSQNEIITAFDNLRYGHYKFLYLSPEKLQSDFIQEKIKQLDVNLIAIDEAHCISEWGHDFRPAYRNIMVLKELVPNVPMIALTATATKRVLQDIIESLELDNISVIKSSLKREHLAYQLTKKKDILYTLKQELKEQVPSIVYTTSRKVTKSTANFLNTNGIRSSYYHGGISSEEKQEAFENWMTEKTPVMVATNAFGMGIDKDNISKIIHVNLPFSLENYMQEAGRAGRNGSKASSTILLNEATISTFKQRFFNGQPTLDFVKNVYRKLNQYFQITLGEKPEQRFSFNFQKFCIHYDLPALKTYNTLKLLEQQEIIFIEDNFNKKSTVVFTANHTTIMNYCDANITVGRLAKLLLRTYGGIFESPKQINEQILSRKLNVNVGHIKDQLNTLQKDGIIEYIPASNNSALFFLQPREDDKTIHRVSKKTMLHISIKEEKMKAVLNYIDNNTVCRSKFLLNYFDERESEDCGICDVCLLNDENAKGIAELAKLILTSLNEHQQLTSRQLVELLKSNKNEVIKSLHFLLETDKIRLTSRNTFEKLSND